MNMEDGFLYTYDILSKTQLKIPQPQQSTDARDFTGSWSPDGKYLLYAANDALGQIFTSIFVTNFAQNTYARVTNWPSIETSPAWSPDNQWVAFAADHAKFEILRGEYAGATDIYVMPTKCAVNMQACPDSSFRQLTYTGSKGDAYYPLWNPNGTGLAYIYINGQTGDQDVYLVDLNGNIKNLTNTPDYSEDIFGWSPDGEKLVFRRNDFATGKDVYILNIADNAITRITNSAETDEGIPFWSPDGGEIAFDENVESSNSGVVIYSVSEKQSQLLPGSDNGEFLFWLTIFPDITSGVTLTVSPSGQNLNIRSEPSIDSAVIGKLQSGNQITIVDQPVEDSQYTWWEIKSDKGEGWVIQNYNWYLPRITDVP